MTAPARRSPGPARYAVAFAAILSACGGRAAAPRASPLVLRNVVFDAGGVLIELENAEWTRRMTPIAGSVDAPAFRSIVERFEMGD